MRLRHVCPRAGDRRRLTKRSSQRLHCVMRRMSMLTSVLSPCRLRLPEPWLSLFSLDE